MAKLCGEETVRACGRPAALELMRRHPRPTAIFGLNDLMAVCALILTVPTGLYICSAEKRHMKPRVILGLHPVKPPVSRGMSRREDPHQVVFFRRHPQDDLDESIPARDFLATCPAVIRAKFSAVLMAVAGAPPFRFSGGGYWEAMHGEMTGWFEVRIDGPKPGGGKGRHHYRLYCLLDYEAKDVDKSLLVVVSGMSKPLRTVLSASDYDAVRCLGDEYRARNPRSFA